MMPVLERRRQELKPWSSTRIKGRRSDAKVCIAPSVATLFSTDQAQSERNRTSDTCSSSTHLKGRISSLQGEICRSRSCNHYIFVHPFSLLYSRKLAGTLFINHESTTYSRVIFVCTSSLRLARLCNPSWLSSFRRILSWLSISVGRLTPILALENAFPPLARSRDNSMPESSVGL
jgi:hypothetical protein